MEGRKYCNFMADPRCWTCGIDLLAISTAKQHATLQRPNSVSAFGPWAYDYEER